MSEPGFGFLDPLHRTLAGVALVEAITEATRARNFTLVAALIYRLALVNPAMAQGVLDAIDYAFELKSRDDS